MPGYNPGTVFTTSGPAESVVGQTRRAASAGANGGEPDRLGKENARRAASRYLDGFSGETRGIQARGSGIWLTPGSPAGRLCHSRHGRQRRFCPAAIPIADITAKPCFSTRRITAGSKASCNIFTPETPGRIRYASVDEEDNFGAA